MRPLNEPKIIAFKLSAFWILKAISCPGYRSYSFSYFLANPAQNQLQSPLFLNNGHHKNPMNLNIFCYLLLALAAVASALLPHPLVMWLLLASVLTFVIYAGDKMAARKSWRRVPESTLLVLGLVGGWPGAVLSQQLFRHKTQKQPFKTYFFITALLNIGVMVALYWFYPNVISLVM